MNQDSIVQIKDWNSSLGTITLTGEIFSSFTIARSLTPENFARLFEDYLNLGAKGFQEGRQAGLKLCKSHRTLQRLAICTCRGSRRAGKQRCSQWGSYSDCQETGRHD